VVALAWPFVAMFISGSAPGSKDLGNIRQDYSAILRAWIVTLAVIGIIMLWERRPLRSVGFVGIHGRDALAGAGLFAIAFICVAILNVGIVAARAHSANFGPEQVKRIAQVPVWIRLAMLLTAGFCEELLFRSYPIERLRELTGNIWWGAVVSLVLFTAGHIPLYGLTLGLLIPFILGLALTVLYVWRRNLPLNATIHALFDAVGLLLVPALVQQGR
jgi:membrane protease YdiL (CAAX protease family)